jgi:hypothetical protein
VEATKVVLAVVGGIGAVAALTIAYRKQRHGEAAEYREEVKLFNDRYAKSAELLGHERAAARMAGIYAMARLADDNAEDWERLQQCIDALCAYLRLPYSPDDPLTPVASGEGTVRHTALRVIRDHLRPTFSTVSWDGHKFNLAGAVFDGGDLTGIRLTSGHMTFHAATFAPGTFHFTRAEILDAGIWFTKAKFSGGDVHFDDAKFIRVKLSFKEAQFTGGTVSFQNAQFIDGSVTFKGAQDRDHIVSFDGARANGPNMDWGPFTQ